LNSRALALGQMFDPYGAGTKMERGLAKAAAGFSKATGMVHWNMGWKSVGGAMVASRMSKSIDAIRSGKASKSDRLRLGANGIDPWMAERIAMQLDDHADKDGQLWLPRGQNWTDPEAFDAFRRAMNREFDIMVITPGQDLPISFSSEVGKFFLQFKSFAFSAHHRILLSGIQRADADVFAQFTTALLLGGLVSNIKSAQNGSEPKEDAAFWEDALDRSGLTGWLMEPYNLAAGFTGGRTSLSGEEVSRFQSRSEFEGLLGPSVDMAAGIYEAAGNYSRGEHSYRDARKVMRAVPGNNLIWFLGVSRQIENSIVEATGGRPRP